MNRYRPGNRLTLLRNGAEYFPALEAAIDSAQREIYLETYIFADDPSGQRIAEALARAAHRGVVVHVLVDGWGAKNFLTDALIAAFDSCGVKFAKFRPEISPWTYRSHRLRRLHRKLVQVDCRIAFVGGINIIDDMNTPAHTAPRIDFAVAIEGPLVGPIVRTMRRLWALVQVVSLGRHSGPLFPHPVTVPRAGQQTAKFVIRDNLRHRRDIENGYLAAIRKAKSEIMIACAYFLPGTPFRHALIAAAQRGVRVRLLLQGRVEYRILHYASRALYGQLLAAGIEILEYRKSFLHAKTAVIDEHWATVGSSNIDPISLLLAREANVFVRDAGFAAELRTALDELIATGAHEVAVTDWASRPRWYKAWVWIAYGFLRFVQGMVGYGNDEWWRPGPARKRRGLRRRHSRDAS
jgi:cardiolipin synthase